MGRAVSGPAQSLARNPTSLGFAVTRPGDRFESEAQRLAERSLDGHASPLVVTQRSGGPMLAGEWIIDNATRKNSTGGKTDGKYVEEAFHEICPLTRRRSDRIVLQPGTVPSNRRAGCECMQEIENDLASASPILPGTPKIGLDVDGWSFTRASVPEVRARHPEGSFRFGYWTAGQDRVTKEFFRTVAHEVCGHVVTCVRTGGKHCGGRRSPTGHNAAIEGENAIASEHGVPVSDLRGLDHDPAKPGTPLPGHRGESFLQAEARAFAHASAATSGTNAKVLSRETVRTVSTLLAGHLDLFVQVEGFAYTNEGGLGLGLQRARSVRRLIEAELTSQGVSHKRGGGGSRFATDLAKLNPGSSQRQTTDPARRVQVYLFHKAHSAGP